MAVYNVGYANKPSLYIVQLALWIGNRNSHCAEMRERLRFEQESALMLGGVHLASESRNSLPTGDKTRASHAFPLNCGQGRVPGGAALLQQRRFPFACETVC